MSPPSNLIGRGDLLGSGAILNGVLFVPGAAVLETSPLEPKGVLPYRLIGFGGTSPGFSAVASRDVRDSIVRCISSFQTNLAEIVGFRAVSVWATGVDATRLRAASSNSSSCGAVGDAL
jgi:hypothetical protein